MFNRLTLTIAASLLSLLLVWGYGLYRYNQGHTAAQIKAQAQAIALQQGLQYERDRADAEYRGVVLARKVAEDALSEQRDRVNRLLDQLHRAKATGVGSGSDVKGTDGIGIFIECLNRYEALGRDAARLADKIAGLQGYIRAITKSNP